MKLKTLGRYQNLLSVSLGLSGCLVLLVTIAALVLLASNNKPSAAKLPATSTTSVALAATISPASPPKAAKSNIRLAHLVSLTAGWVLTDQGLLWTANAGKEWKNITPVQVAPKIIRGVLFLDPWNGWLVISGSPDPTTKATPLEIMRTTDGGSSWTKSLLAAPNLFYTDSTTLPALVNFVDGQHGWVMVRLSSSSNFSRGNLFQTVDGGATWKELSIPIGGAIKFINSLEGWTAGGAGGNEIYSTRNGGQTWQKISVVLPSVFSDAQPEYDLPTFQNAQEGVLPVTFVGSNQVGIGFYSTNDSGKTWQNISTISFGQSVNIGVRLPSSIVNATEWIYALPNKSQIQKVSQKGQNQSLLASNGLPSSIVIDKLDFVNEISGWTLTSLSQCASFKSQCTYQTQLFSTQDGGQSWTEITP